MAPLTDHSVHNITFDSIRYLMSHEHTLTILQKQIDFYPQPKRTELIYKTKIENFMLNQKIYFWKKKKNK